MVAKNPYDIIKRRHVTEKAMVLQELKNAKSSRSLARCNKPKYVFLVHPDASKADIARALEEIYKEQNIKVNKVNTINVKAKPTRKRRGKVGFKSSFKKAIVTLDSKDDLDNI